MPFFNSFRTLVLLTLAIAAILTYRNIKNEGRTHIHERRNTGGTLQCSATGQIALTFDNGIHTIYTPALLNVLKEKQVTGTFHVAQTGFNDPLVVAILQRIMSEKHILGLMYKGPIVQSIGELELRQALITQMKAFHAAVGVYPRFIRFPYNTANEATYKLVSKMGFVPTMYNIDSKDYLSCNNPDALFVSVPKEVTSPMAAFMAAGNLKGSFISLHSDLCDISKSIGATIDLVKKNYGYNFVALDECVRSSERYFANYPTNDQNPIQQTTLTTSSSSSTSLSASSSSLSSNQQGQDGATSTSSSSSASASSNSQSTSTSTPKKNSAAQQTRPTLLSMAVAIAALVLLVIPALT